MSTIAPIAYETVFIAEPEIPADQIDQLIAKLKQTIESHQGTVVNEDRWGKRRLAYPIEGHREGFYTVMTFTAAPTVTSALDHFYNVTDTVIRFMTIRQVIRKKILPPRRERPAGASDAPHRPAYRPTSPSRPRSDSGASSRTESAAVKTETPVAKVEPVTPPAEPQA